MNIGSLLPDTLEEYVRKAQPLLIEVAKRKAFITYGELIKKLGGPGRGYIGEVIGQISENEVSEGRPKLSAVVVRSDTWMVGGGFFGLPQIPKAIRRSTPEKLQDPNLSDADYKYWQGELKEVYRYWR
jgi:hypothetical protein